MQASTLYLLLEDHGNPVRRQERFKTDTRSRVDFPMDEDLSIIAFDAIPIRSVVDFFGN